MSKTAGEARQGRPGSAAAITSLGYAVVCYALFLGSILYLVGFVLGLLVPKTVDTGHSQVPAAVLIDVALFAIFGLQHSVMARPRFKALLTRLVPAHAERSTFILASVVVLVLLMVAWQPLPVVVWRVGGVPGLLLDAVALAGIGLAVLDTFMIDHFDFGGLRQAFNHVSGRPAIELPFTQRFLYRQVRHPIMLGFLLLFWVTPQMTFGHLLFAVLATAYILVGTHYEERNLVDAIGPRYSEYRRTVPSMLPTRLGRK